MLQAENGINKFESSDIAASDTYLSSFFHDVDKLRDEVNAIAKLVEEIKLRHSEILAAPNQVEKTKARVEEITSEIKRKAGSIRSSLKELERIIQQEESAGGDDIRIKRMQHQSIGKRFMTVMHDYSKVQTEYHNANKKRIMRLMAIADRHITDDELDTMLASGNIAVFTQSILADTQEARQTLNDIEARHQDILRLEQSIRELQEMFADAAALVDTQGEALDRIEFNVVNAKDYIEVAKTDTSKALEYQKKSRKKKIILGVVLTSVLLIIIISLLATLVPR